MFNELIKDNIMLQINDYQKQIKDKQTEYFQNCSKINEFQNLINKYTLDSNYFKLQINVTDKEDVEIINKFNDEIDDITKAIEIYEFKIKILLALNESIIVQIDSFLSTLKKYSDKLKNNDFKEELSEFYDSFTDFSNSQVF